MIQRIQTVLLLLAMVASLACLCLPLIAFEPKGMGADVVLTNFCIGDHLSTKALPLALLQLLSLPVAGAAIALFRNRPLQMRLCMVGMVLMLLWCAWLAFVALTHEGCYSFGVGTFLPLVALVLYWWARHAIKADEALVRAADRIR